MNKEKKNPNKCPICGRPTHKESKYCIFHASAEEKTEGEFKRALKEYVKEIKKEDKDYDFERFVFIGDINFEEDLNVTTFKKTRFARAIFKGNVSFMGAAFEGSTSFWGVTFEAYASFNQTTFKGDVSFRRATFEEDAHFSIKNIKGYLNFNNAEFIHGKTLTLFVKDKIIISFNKTYLENVFLGLYLGEEPLIDFSDVLLRNTNIEKDQIENHILQEHEENYYQARKIYLLLKNNFHTIGQYDDESWAYKKEKDMDRLSHSYPFYMKELKRKDKKEKLPFLKWIKKGNFKKWITSAFSNMIYGYGERPWNVVKTALAIIIIFALSFSLIGIGNPEIIELKGTAIYQNSGNIVDLESKGFLKNNEIRNFPDCLYFSLITFTTLGYGDFRPLEGWGRIFAGSEAFLGAIMMALFVYTFARRTGGR
jgi:uncharacterized protein YjbI with pentapeptide repeats